MSDGFLLICKHNTQLHLLSMRIGFDAKRAVQNMTGLGNYSRYVLGALLTYFPENEYLLFAPKKRTNNRLDAIIANKPNVKIVTPKRKSFSSLWRVFGIWRTINNHKVDIFHGLSSELPLTICKTNGKSIVTVHDLIFRTMPHCYKFFDRKIYDYKFRRACQNADIVVAVSQCTKRDIVRFYHIPEEKIQVIYQGCDEAFSSEINDEQIAEVRKEYQLPEKYVLCVGSIEERKNAQLAVEALPHLSADIHLVLVGKQTPYCNRILAQAQKDEVANRVHLLSGVPFAHLMPIYKAALVFVYPSRYEGFGIPIVEALNVGVPVIAATGSCLEEAGGGGSIYVSPDDAKALADAIMQTHNPATRSAMIEQGKQHAAQFTKEQMAKQTMDCYLQLVKQ